MAQPLLIEGLKRLEYRGYDSAGIAVIDDKGELHIRRAVGRISVLESAINDGNPLPACAASAWPTRAGRRTARPPKSTPTRTPTTTAASRWFTTASSKTMPR